MIFLEFEELEKNLASVDVGAAITNRGAAHTLESWSNLSCDWVSVTSTFFYDHVAFLSTLHLDFSLFEEQENSRNGFKKMYIYNGITLLLEHSKCAFMLDISGSGCRFLESLGHLYDWVEIFKIFVFYEVNFTRVDLALDSFNNTSFTLDTMYRKIKLGHVKGTFKKVRNVEDINFFTGEEVGRTLYFGSPKSKVMFRFYDKLGESLSKGKDVDLKINSWIRFEMQLRDSHARGLIYQIILGGIDDIGIYFCGYLRNNLEFLVPSGDGNKWRWKVCKWWVDFLNGVEKLPLNLSYKEPTLFRKVNWLEVGVSKSNALVNLASSMGLDNPLNYDDGFLKLYDSKKDLAIFNDFLEKSGRDSIDMYAFNSLIDKHLLKGIKKDDSWGR